MLNLHVFLGKIVGKNLEQPFLAILSFFSESFSVHITLIECNGLESNEICTFLVFTVKFKQIHTYPFYTV